MHGAGILVFLIFISSIPAIAVFIWFRRKRYSFPPALFFLSLLAGTTSFFPALYAQDYIPAAGIAGIFARALSEETSRLLLLLILLVAAARLYPAYRIFSKPERNQDIPAVAAGYACGLIAGLGFAIIESAVYGASTPINALLRVFTAAPLHGACGARVGSSITLFRRRPPQAIFRFFTAVAIHGVYNTMLFFPGKLPLAVAVLLVISAFASTVTIIHRGMQEKGNPQE